MYLTAILLERTESKPREIVTKKGTRDEVEEFIFEYMDDMVKCVTRNEGTKVLDKELTF